MKRIMVTAALIAATTATADGVVYRDNANARFVRNGLLETKLISAEESLEIIAAVQVVCTSGYVMSTEVHKITNYASGTVVTASDLPDAEREEFNEFFADFINDGTSDDWKREWNTICQIGKTLMGWQTIN